MQPPELEANRQVNARPLPLSSYCPAFLTRRIVAKPCLFPYFALQDLVKPEGVSLYNSDYAYVLDNTEPFPDVEYAKLVQHFHAPSPIYANKVFTTRLGTERKTLLRTVPPLSEMANGGAALYTHITALRAKGQHLAALINLRLVKEYIINLGFGQHAAPWLPPSLSSPDLTNDGIHGYICTLTHIRSQSKPTHPLTH
jgi:hypothetical protein